MLKRVRYASRFATPLACDDIKRVADVAATNNASRDITRICPDWSMRRVALSTAKTREFVSLRASLGAILTLTGQVKSLVAGVEETVWALILDAELQDKMERPGKATR